MVSGPGGGKSSTSNGVQKHRACDECRSRKLACSKEPNGCSRCRREGITCHYSPQKPMGRPRKRRHVDASPPKDAARDEFTLGDEAPAVTSAADQNSTASQPFIPMDPELSFLDQTTGPPSMDFMDLLPPTYANTPHHDAQYLSAVQGSGYDAASLSYNSFGGVDLLGGINFDDSDLSTDPFAVNVSKDINDTLQDFIATQPHRQVHMQPPLEPPEGSASTPSDMSHALESPPSSLASSQHPTSMKPIPSVNCGCMTSLYLALDSLSHLPEDVLGAVRVARNASKVAHDVAECPFCFTPDNFDLESPPPIQSFQNMMFLGTLLPSACNAYAAILEKVDAEVEKAKMEGRTLWFSFRDAGGLWGHVAADGNPCSKLQTYNNRHMPPDVWRSTVRAVLRLDVYGVSAANGGGCGTPSPYTQKGLRDVVTMLDERSRKRHDMIDSMIDKGQAPKHSPYILFPGTMKSVPLEQRNCHRVLEAARIALDNLVIS